MRNRLFRSECWRKTLGFAYFLKLHYYSWSPFFVQKGICVTRCWVSFIFRNSRTMIQTSRRKQVRGGEKWFLDQGSSFTLLKLFVFFKKNKLGQLNFCRKNCIRLKFKMVFETLAFQIFLWYPIFCSSIPAKSTAWSYWIFVKGQKKERLYTKVLLYFLIL